MREQNTTALVIPAHTLKGEARQLGAEPLARIAEPIESTARFCVESHRFPDELAPQVVELRRLFGQTVEAFDRETNPLMQRGTGPQGGFGRRVNNQGVGRLQVVFSAAGRRARRAASRLPVRAPRAS